METHTIELSSGFRMQELTTMLDVLRRDIFRARSRIGSGRAMTQQAAASRVNELEDVEEAIQNEILWLQNTGIPADRLREQMPRALNALRQAAGYLASLPQGPDRGVDIAALTIECKTILALIDAANQTQD